MDREKVIKALSICVPETQDDSRLECSDCPYGNVCNPNDIVGITLPLIWDIRALLKEQNTVEHALDILREHGWKETEDVPYANEQERHPVIVCPHCGKRVK